MSPERRPRSRYGRDGGPGVMEYPRVVDQDMEAPRACLSSCGPLPPRYRGPTRRRPRTEPSQTRRPAGHRRRTARASLRRRPAWRLGPRYARRRASWPGPCLWGCQRPLRSRLFRLAAYPASRRSQLLVRAEPRFAVTTHPTDLQMNRRQPLLTNGCRYWRGDDRRLATEVHAGALPCQRGSESNTRANAPYRNPWTSSRSSRRSSRRTS